MAGYKLNGGEMQDLTNIQKIAIFCMKEIHRRHMLSNEAFLVVD